MSSNKAMPPGENIGDSPIVVMEPGMITEQEKRMPVLPDRTRFTATVAAARNSRDDADRDQVTIR